MASLAFVVLLPAGAGEAPGFTAETLRHESLSIDDYRGKVVLLQFWASWCKSCIASIASLQSLYEKHGDRGFEIIGISLDEAIEDARRAVAEQGMSWPQVCDGRGKDSPVARRYDVKGTPHYVLIDRDGAVAAPYVRAGEIEQRLTPLLTED